jgi:hypothetical protein
MKNLHPARKRLVAGILMLAIAFFYAFAPTCGAIGHLVARGSAYLLGQTGSSLVALTLFTVGGLFVIPHGAIGALVRWAWHGREARVGRVVADMDRFVTTKREARQVDVEHVKKIVIGVLREHGRKVVQDAVAGEIVTRPPAERMRLDDVRGALKNLGYLKNEYEPVVAGLDPKLPLETLVRGAIKTLHGKAN